MRECDAAIVGLGTAELPAAYHIKQPRTNEWVPAIGRMGNTLKYAHAEKS